MEFTLADGGTKIKVPKYVPLSITFDEFGILNSGKVEQRDLTLTGYVQTIVAVDVPRGWTIDFDLNTKGSEKMTVTAPAAGSGYYTAAGTATLLVSDGNTQTITKQLLLATDAYVPPPAPDIEFDLPLPGAFTLGEPQDIGFTVQGEVKTILAVDVPRGWTVEPKLNEAKITVTPPANDGKYYTATGTVKLLVSDDAARTTIKPLSLSCPAYTPPAKLDITIEQLPTFLKGETKEVAFTTQGNATTVKVLDVPADWTVTVAKQDNKGTFTITANACTGEGEAIVLVADVDGNTVMRTLELAYTPAAVTLSATLNGGDRTLAVINAEMAVVEYTASAGIPSAALTGAPAGVSGSFTGNTFSVYGMPTEAGEFNYTVTLNIEKDNHCAIATTGVLEVENCTDCAVWTTCEGVKYVSNKDSEGSMNWSTANAYCQNKAAGWRLPTFNELKCMCAAKITLPESYVSSGYWSSTYATYTGNDYYYYYVMLFSDCGTSYYTYYSNGYVKCVK